MCAQFIIRSNVKKLQMQFPFVVEGDLSWKERIVPFYSAPVIVKSGSERALKLMQFSLLPSWSKERRVKFASYNARLDTIDQKPLWKKPFQTHHCVVPMEEFIEPVYTGEYAGNMVSFQDRSTEVLLAAGIWDEWVDHKTGEIIDSFSIITTDPPKFVKEIGHDRCPLFLTPEGAEKWLDPHTSQPQKLKSLLLEHEAKLHLSASKDREMKPGWERRK